MRYIFREASCVIGWLGESSDAKRALNISTMVQYFGLTKEIGQAKPGMNEWAFVIKEFETFLSNPWFEGAWIIQGDSRFFESNPAVWTRRRILLGRPC